MKKLEPDKISKTQAASVMVIDLPCSEDDLLFFNGYQTWTLSREVKPDDTIRNSRPVLKLIGKPWGTQRYGDGFFTHYPENAGCFHGFTYCYRRRGDTYTLFASYDESNGYTIFSYDAATGELHIEKDAGFGADCDLSLHICAFEGTEDEVFDAWFSELETKSGIKRRPAEPLAGYSSWYNRYADITDETISADLDGCSKILKEGDLFQIDDGWQQSVGVWEANTDKFPRGMKASVDDIHSRGLLAGLWLAPFSVQKDSALIKEHPDWLLVHDGRPWYTGCNWGGFYSLDIDNPGVKKYLKNVFDRILNEWGFDLVKLDFLYSAAPHPTLAGSNYGESRGSRMVRAMKLLREWCGDKLILGCGVPLGPAFGLVDYCRVGCDASLDWNNTRMMRLVNNEIVSTRNAICDSYYRRQLDGRAFLNDPDVFFLREDNIKLTPEERLMHAKVCAQYGSFLLTSDNMGEYDKQQLSDYADLRNIWEVKKWTDLSFLKALC